MNKDIQKYNDERTEEDQKICTLLYEVICKNLPNAENKIWHGHPVWFLEGNPIVGYSKLKVGLRLMFWSGVSFEETLLLPSKQKKFKDASIIYENAKQINKKDLIRWLEKAREIQWDYKNIVKRKGVLVRLK